MYIGSYAYPFYVVFALFVQFTIALIVAGMLFYFGHAQAEMNENMPDLEARANSCVKHSDGMGFVCVTMAVMQLVLMIESFWRESWLAGTPCIDCHFFYLFNFVTYIVTAMVLFNQVIKLNELVSKIPITDTDEFISAL